MPAAVSGVQAALEAIRAIILDKLNARLTAVETARASETHAYGPGTTARPLPKITADTITLGRRFRRGVNPAIRLYVNSKAEVGPKNAGCAKYLQSEVSCSIALKTMPRSLDDTDIALRLYADAITYVIKENYYDYANYNADAAIITIDFSSSEEAGSLVEKYDIDGLDVSGAGSSGSVPTFEVLPLLLSVTQKQEQAIVA